MKYSHAVDFAAEVLTDNDADNVTGAEIRQALLDRINLLTDNDLLDACDVFDTSQLD